MEMTGSRRIELAHRLHRRLAKGSHSQPGPSYQPGQRLRTSVAEAFCKRSRGTKGVKPQPSQSAFSLAMRSAGLAWRRNTVMCAIAAVGCIWSTVSMVKRWPPGKPATSLVAAGLRRGLLRQSALGRARPPFCNVSTLKANSGSPQPSQ